MLLTFTLLVIKDDRDENQRDKDRVETKKKTKKLRGAEVTFHYTMVYLFDWCYLNIWLK